MNAPLRHRGAMRTAFKAKAIAGALGLALSGAAILALGGGRSEAEAPKPGPASVRVAPARAIQRPDELRAYGSLAYGSKRDVAALEAGEIVELAAREGDRLGPGHAVARLRNVQLEYAAERAMDGIAAAEAALALAESRLFEGRLGAEARLIGLRRNRLELERARRELAEAERRQADQETLLSVGGVTEETVRAGRLALESARTALALLELEAASGELGLRDVDLRARGLAVPDTEAGRSAALLSLATEGLEAERSAAAARLKAARTEASMAASALGALVLRAGPGIVAARAAEVGELVSSGDRIVTIIDMSTVYAVVRAGEAEAARLEPGRPASVSVDATGLSYAGVVEAVSPLADARSGTLSVRIALSGADEALRPGMFARADICLGPPRRVIVIGEEALASIEGDQAVAYVAVAGRASERRLWLGNAEDGERVVLSGLDEGDAVILNPGRELKEGDYVDIEG